MFEKSDNNIRSNRNLYRNRDMIDNQLKENPQREENYKIQEHIIDTASIYMTGTKSQTSFKEDFDISSSEALQIMNSSNIFTPEQIHTNRFNKFARYGIIDPYHENLGSREYLFFSKPDLHIFSTNNNFTLYEPLQEVPFFKSAFKQYPESLLSLQQTFYSSSPIHYPNKFNVKNKFIPLLSNQVSSSLDLPSITATETQNNANLFQINTSYRDSSEISDCNYEFNLEFKDTKYLDVYMFFKAYDEYIRQEYLKDIRPTKLSYIEDKINSKQFSIWKIIVDDTNTVMFHAKTIGVSPLSVPRDTMSNFEGNSIKTTVSFKGQFIQDSNPIHLQELNHLTALSLGKTEEEMESYINNNVLSLYDSNNWVPNTEWGAYPYIIKGGKRHDATELEGEFYKLIWLKG